MGNASFGLDRDGGESSGRSSLSFTLMVVMGDLDAHQYCLTSGLQPGQGWNQMMLFTQRREYCRNHRSKCVVMSCSRREKYVWV